MTNTTPMTHIDSGKTADVHVDEVDNWKVHGWREGAPIAPPPPLVSPPPGAPPAQSKPTLSLKR